MKYRRASGLAEMAISPRTRESSPRRPTPSHKRPAASQVRARNPFLSGSGDILPEVDGPARRERARRETGQQEPGTGSSGAGFCSLGEFRARKEIADFRCGCLRRIRTARAIVLNAFAEFLANGARKLG